MKTTNFKKALSTSVPLIGGLLFAACGGSGGGGGHDYSNIQIGAQDYEIVYPSSRSTTSNVCTSPTVQILMKNDSSCSFTGVGNLVSIFNKNTGVGTPLSVNEAIPFPRGNDCLYYVPVRQALKSSQTYYVGIYANKGARDILPQTAEFTTANESAVDCGDGSRFVLANAIGSSTPQSTNLSQLGTYDSSGKYQFDIGGVLRNGITGVTQNIVSSVFGAGMIRSTDPIKLEFNEPVNADTLVAIQVLKTNVSFDNLNVAQTVNVRIQQDSNDPSSVRILPPTDGYAPNSGYYVYVGALRSALGKPLSAPNQSTPRAWVSFFRVGG